MRIPNRNWIVRLARRLLSREISRYQGSIAQLRLERRDLRREVKQLTRAVQMAHERCDEIVRELDEIKQTIAEKLDPDPDDYTAEDGEDAEEFGNVEPLTEADEQQIKSLVSASLHGAQSGNAEPLLAVDLAELRRVAAERWVRGTRVGLLDAGLVTLAPAPDGAEHGYQLSRRGHALLTAIQQGGQLA